MQNINKKITRGKHEWDSHMTRMKNNRIKLAENIIQERKKKLTMTPQVFER